MFEYRYLQLEHAEAAAEIHVEGQPGTVLTLLGHRFLVEFYRAVVQSRWAEGFGVFNENDELVAQSVIASSTDRFFAEFKLRHLWRVALPVTWAVIRNLQIIPYVVNGWSYADMVRSPEGECDVIFLGVKREYLRQGVGPELVRHMFGWTGSIGLQSANLMIEKRNRPMRWMIGQLNGLHIAHEFEAYGRSMLFYKVPIAANLEDAKMPQGQPYASVYTFSKDGKDAGDWS
jgi:ribosomal protein S18 acetylase RimI-like enzyme